MSVAGLQGLWNGVWPWYVPEDQGLSDILGYLLQGCLLPAYRVCGMERGTGMFQRIKDYLSGGIDKQKPRMFHSASKELMNELLALKVCLI